MTVKNQRAADALVIGTSGYSYEDWRGVFYPQDLPKSKMLEYYSRFFTAVEVNSSYYAIPSSKTAERMAQKTAAGFEFIFKTHQETTHIRPADSSALTALLENLLPLRQADKLSGLLAQFPFSFKNNDPDRRYLLSLREVSAEVPLFVEFRHDSWNKPQVAEFLKANDIGYVNVDEPPLPGLLPAQEIVTSANAYIRFHGRNSRQWWHGQGSQRYDYLYPEEELRQWITHIRSILRRSAKTYIFFNNHPRGQAVANARHMQNIIASHIFPGSGKKP